MPDWLFWTLFIGVPVLILIVCAIVFAYSLDALIRHYKDSQG